MQDQTRDPDKIKENDLVDQTVETIQELVKELIPETVADLVSEPVTDLVADPVEEVDTVADHIEESISEPSVPADSAITQENQEQENQEQENQEQENQEQNTQQALAEKSENDIPQVEEQNTNPVNLNSSPDSNLDAASQIALLLKTERERQGLSIGKVVEVIKFRPTQIESIERGDFSVLPSGFGKGFIRNYAKFLGIENQVGLLIGEAFKSSKQLDINDLQVNTKAKKSMTYSDKRKSNFPWKILFIVLSILVLLAVVYFWQDKSNKELKKQSQAQLDQVNQIVTTPDVDLDNVQVVPLQQDEQLVEVLTNEQSIGDGEQLDLTNSRINENPSTNQIANQHNVLKQQQEQAQINSAQETAAKRVEIEKRQREIAERSKNNSHRAEQNTKKVELNQDSNLQAGSAVELEQQTSSAVASRDIPLVDNLASRSKDTIAINVKQRSRLTVYDSTGKVLINQIVPGGTQHQFKGKPPFRVRLTNANGASISHAGESQIFDEQEEDQTVSVKVP